MGEGSKGGEGPKRSLAWAIFATIFATGLLLAIVGAGLWALIFLPGESASPLAVPQRVSSPLAIDSDGRYSIGATGSADGVPGAVVLRVGADGLLDPTFAERGVAFHRVGVGDTKVDSIVAEETARSS